VRAIIIAAGKAEQNEDWQRWVQAGDVVVGADGGAARARAWGLTVDVIVGDMDSLAEEEQAALALQGGRFIHHPRAKDETDLELALNYALEAGAEEIVILGALGGRLDHTLGNVLLLTLPHLAGMPTRIVSHGQEALVIRGGDTGQIEGQPGDLVSLLPLGGDARAVTTQGLAWSLAGETLRFGSSRGISNEMTSSTAQVQVGEGFLLAVHLFGSFDNSPVRVGGKR